MLLAASTTPFTFGTSQVSQSPAALQATLGDSCMHLLVPSSDDKMFGKVHVLHAHLAITRREVDNLS